MDNSQHKNAIPARRETQKVRLRITLEFRLETIFLAVGVHAQHSTAQQFCDLIGQRSELEEAEATETQMTVSWRMGSHQNVGKAHSEV